MATPSSTAFLPHRRLLLRSACCGARSGYLTAASLRQGSHLAQHLWSSMGHCRDGQLLRAGCWQPHLGQFHHKAPAVVGVHQPRAAQSHRMSGLLKDVSSCSAGAGGFEHRSACTMHLHAFGHMFQLVLSDRFHAQAPATGGVHLPCTAQGATSRPHTNADML